jgi:hypothetical protein
MLLVLGLTDVPNTHREVKEQVVDIPPAQKKTKLNRQEHSFSDC